MSTIVNLNITNSPLSVGFPQRAHIIVDYSCQCNGVVPNKTILQLDYQIINNNANVVFTNGSLNFKSRITLQGNVTPLLHDTLMFLRIGASLLVATTFDLNIKAKLISPNSPVFVIGTTVNC